MNTLDNATRARLSKLINRLTDCVCEIRTITIALLEEQAIQQNLPEMETPAVMEVPEIPYVGDFTEVTNIEPMKKVYKDIVLSKRQSRWASVGQVSTYDLCQHMKDEFPHIGTKDVSKACTELGIETYMHGHSKYINHMMADVIADYFRRDR